MLCSSSGVSSIVWRAMYEMGTPLVSVSAWASRGCMACFNTVCLTACGTHHGAFYLCQHASEGRGVLSAMCLLLVGLWCQCHRLWGSPVVLVAHQYRA
jgi:hypothetical protein